MTAEDDVRYRALAARDSRFDGAFFVGVKSTGIYCRPICTAKTPGRERCTFYDSAALAEQAGFRPCLRCRPELAPGRAPVDSVRTTALAAAARIEAGALSDGGSLEDLAAGLELSSRQLRRAMRAELGVSPVELAQTNRLLLAKRLLSETGLPMTQVAFAAGFASVRRFNDIFRRRYRLTPSALRRSSSSQTVEGDAIRLTLAYRPPLAWDAALEFLAARGAPGVEAVVGDAYHRTVDVGGRRGWLRVSRVEDRNLLAVELAATLTPALPSILSRLRNLFDLDARPDLIDEHLGLDPLFASQIETLPGLRVPGAFDGFELALRAILGQQISVRAASTLAGRIAEKFGEPVEMPIAGLNRLAPSAASLAAVSVREIESVGLPRTRAESVRILAQRVAQGEIALDPGSDPTRVVARLLDVPGIGSWTAEYVAMRALRWPDAFPTSDLGLIKASSSKSARELEAKAERWRPWRAYAAMRLWQGLATSVRK